MRRAHLLVGLGWAASLAIAVAITRPGGSPPATPATPPAAPLRVAAPAASTPAAPSRALPVEDLRRVVREELAAAPATEPAPEPSPELVAEARAVVDGAIDRGRWTDDAREELRMRTSSLTRAELDQVLQILFVALNEGRVQRDVSGPLL